MHADVGSMHGTNKMSKKHHLLKNLSKTCRESRQGHAACHTAGKLHVGPAACDASGKLT
jgi:hypothetical protein